MLDKMEMISAQLSSLSLSLCRFRDTLSVSSMEQISGEELQGKQRKRRKKERDKYPEQLCEDGEGDEGERKGKWRNRDGVRPRLNEDGEADGVEQEDERLLRDPLEVFGSDIMLMILRNLHARSVALSLLVSRAWYDVASSDRVWSSKCEELWLRKAHIPRLSRSNRLSKLAAYSFAIEDSKRTCITKEDLCDHVWEFHFNLVAPDYWRNLDPYWKGTIPRMRRYFHKDGSQSADPDDKVWGGHECFYTIVTSRRVSDGIIRKHYVRINRWPIMSVSRKSDWSWEMSNCLFYYSSLPDADKEEGTGPLFPVV